MARVGVLLAEVVELGLRSCGSRIRVSSQGWRVREKQEVDTEDQQGDKGNGDPYVSLPMTLEDWNGLYDRLSFNHIPGSLRCTLPTCPLRFSFLTEVPHMGHFSVSNATLDSASSL